MIKLIVKNEPQQLVLRFPGVQGPPGRVTFEVSAYQEWLDAGHVGTVEDFFQYLKGDQGIQGNPGDDGADGDDGAPGLSAFQVWWAAQSEGEYETEEEALAAYLAYNQGTEGPQGVPGTSGTPGFIDRFTYSTNQSLDLAHANSLVVMTNASLLTFYLPGGDDFPPGKCVHIRQGGAGQIEFTHAGGVTLLFGASFQPLTMEQNAVVTLICEAEDVFTLGGALAYAEEE